MSIPRSSLLAHFNASPPGRPPALQAAEAALGVRLPDDYKSFLIQHNGGEGFIGGDYLILWAAEELAKLNGAYEVRMYAPRLVLFGSTGGGEGLAFDTQAVPFTVVQVPFVGMTPNYADRIAKNFDEFLRGMFQAGQAPLDERGQTSNELRGREIFEIQPIILGGSPIDPENKVVLTREQHIDLVRYWNQVISKLRSQISG